MPKATVIYKISLIAISALLSVLFFQNCSEVNFEQAPEKSSTVDPLAQFRVKTFDPGFKAPPEVHVHAVLDDSASMQLIKSKVKNALSSSVGILNGLDGQVDVYTTSQDSNFVKPVSEVFLKENSEEIQLEFNELLSFLDENKNKPFTYFNFDNYLLNPLFPSLSYNSSMSETEFDGFSSSFANQISNVDIADGDSIVKSEQEQGLCALLRVANQNREDGKFHAYIIASNEDDQTDWRTCLKRKERPVNNTLVEVDVPQNCQPGDPDCNFEYFIDYKQNQKSYVLFDRVLPQSHLKVGLLDPTAVQNFDLETKNYQLFLKFREMKRSRKYFFKNTVIVDGVEFASDEKTKTYTEIGLCSSVSVNRPCSIDERNNLNAHPGTTCTATCVDYRSNKTLVTSERKKWVGSSINYNKPNLSDYNLPDASCSEQVNHILNNEYPSQNYPYIANDKCDILVHMNTHRDTYSVDIDPANCNEGAAKVNCSEGELESLLQTSGIAPAFLNAPVDKITCSTSCSIIPPAAPKSYSIGTDGDSCEGISINDTDTKKTYECNEDDIQLALKKANLPASANISCEKSCYHKKYASRKVSGMSIDNTTCSVGKRDCNSAELSLVDAIYSGTITKCENVCENNSRSACRIPAGTNESFCETIDVQSLGAYCHVSIPGAPLLADSCRIASASKTVKEFKYQLLPGSAKDISFGNPSEEVPQTAAKMLEDSHGNLYYMASFNYPSSSNSQCLPTHQAESKGARYEQLADIVGKHGDTFPVCLEDYSDSFASIFNLIKKEALRSYKLDLDASKKEQVNSVSIRHGNESKQEVSNSKYSVSGGTLTFDPSVEIKENTMIFVEIKYYNN